MIRAVTTLRISGLQADWADSLACLEALDTDSAPRPLPSLEPDLVITAVRHEGERAKPTVLGVVAGTGHTFPGPDGRPQRIFILDGPFLHPGVAELQPSLLTDLLSLALCQAACCGLDEGAARFSVMARFVGAGQRLRFVLRGLDATPCPAPAPWFAGMAGAPVQFYEFGSGSARRAAMNASAIPHRPPSQIARPSGRTAEYALSLDLPWLEHMAEDVEALATGTSKADWKLFAEIQQTPIERLLSERRDDEPA